MLGDGGDCLADLGAVRDQDSLFGAVASDSTAFRVIDAIASTPGLLDAVAEAHALARERVWNQTGPPERVTIEVDATLLSSHSEKEGAAGDYKGGFGFHPLIVIGTDAHKRTHALGAVDEGTGRVRGGREITADEAGHLAAVRWARELDDERVWAIEDCRHVSRRLEQALIAAGERVVRVAPHRIGASRRGERTPGKSDQIDALAIARAVVKDGVDAFPAAYLDERAMEIRLLSDHRSDLVAERTRMQSRVRWHLLALCPELEASLEAALAGPLWSVRSRARTAARSRAARGLSWRRCSARRCTRTRR
ncbi:MAG: transposase [Solirubrobacteraceae bacterium]|jgi:hypothetical protein|nr:transposase [Solirubrobacteraceae bacterium]